ncbi:MAG: hypothetical protein AAF411_01290 [Myxococcota bacterium]
MTGRAKLALAAAILGALAFLATPYVRAAVLLLRLDDVPTEPITATLGPLEADRYGSGPPILLVHGVHPEGNAEARTRALASAIARDGFTVYALALDELAAFHFDASIVQRLGDAGDALQGSAGPFGIVAISVGGTIALRARAERGWSGAVLTIGAPASLRSLVEHHRDSGSVYAERVLNALAGGLDLSDFEPSLPQPDGSDPIFLLHGTDDSLVPVSHVYELCEAVHCEQALETRWLSHADRHGESPWSVIAFASNAFRAMR